MGIINGAIRLTWQSFREIECSVSLSFHLSLFLFFLFSPSFLPFHFFFLSVSCICELCVCICVCVCVYEKYNKNTTGTQHFDYRPDSWSGDNTMLFFLGVLCMRSKDSSPSLLKQSHEISKRNIDWTWHFLDLHFIQRQWTAFLGAWCPQLVIRSCFVKFALRWIVLSMNL